MVIYTQFWDSPPQAKKHLGFFWANGAIYQSNSFITPPLIKIFPKKENAEKKKRKGGKVILYVLELSWDSQIIKQTSTY